MSDGQIIVQAARGWVGTPYRHQGGMQGVGADCLGLLRGIWQEVYGQPSEAPPAYSRDWDEVGRQELLWQAAQRHLIAKPLTEPSLGDVLLFRMRAGAVAKHLGVQSATGTAPRFIHAYSGHGVVDSPLSLPWQRRIIARFRWPPGPHGASAFSNTSSTQV